LQLSRTHLCTKCLNRRADNVDNCKKLTNNEPSGGVTQTLSTSTQRFASCSNSSRFVRLQPWSSRASVVERAFGPPSLHAQSAQPRCAESRYIKR